MLAHRLMAHTPSIRDDQGFTLIELLVSMLMAVVVTGALFAILEVSVGQTTLITDKVQANQLGRIAMTRIVDELHSSCIAPNFAPIQEKSGESELIFKNAYSSEAVIPNAKEAKTPGTGVYQHQIVWNKTAGTLTDFTYKSTSGEGTEAIFPSLDYSSTTHEAPNATPAKGVLLASNMTQTQLTNSKGEVIKNPKGEPEVVPIFQYYKYAKESGSSATTPEGTLTPIVSKYVPLKAETEIGSEIEKENSAGAVSSVLVSFRQTPRDGKTNRDQFVDLSNQATLALSAPNSETPIQDSPCE
jgi:type II secretory pathway pseudopilin PulG